MTVLTPAALLADLMAQPPATPAALLAALMEAVRPPRNSPQTATQARLHALCTHLRQHPDHAAWLRHQCNAWLADAQLQPLLTDAGVLARRGFLSELTNRLYERFLPLPAQPDDLRDTFNTVFHHAHDAQWVRHIPQDAWRELAELLGWSAPPDSPLDRTWRRAGTLAVRMLALRMAAEATQPEWLRLAGAHRPEATALLDLHAACSAASLETPPNAGQLAPLLHQSTQALAHLRAAACERGTSVRLTYSLERIEQQLRRLTLLITALDPEQPAAQRDARFELFLDWVQASATRRQIAPVWQANTRLLARRITEHAGRRGEHYATRTPSEYRTMLRAAMGAGALIALMALLKIQIKAAGWPPLLETLAVCADYALGFVLIHMLHLTVATKQPAMTAALIAASIEDAHQGGPPRPGGTRLGSFAELVASVTRTQSIAIVGNLVVALSTAALVAWAVGLIHDAPLLTQTKATGLLHELNPWSGLAVLHAAIAGVWLFVAGLVSGWYDNRCALLDLPARVRHSPWLGWLSATRRARLADYLGAHLGAIMGNLVFGCLLGATALVGFLLGLPIDIRHVAFAAANLGYAAISLPLPLAALAWPLFCVLLIAATNLAVSFGLALTLALRARGVSMQRAPALWAALLAHARRQPRDFLLPPKEPLPSSPHQT